jgi:hypothetical protein
MGQSQQQIKGVPPRPPKENSLREKKSKRERLKEIDTKEMLTEDPEEFLKTIKQTPGE